MQRFLGILLLLFFSAVATFAQPILTDYVEAELVSEVTSVQPGESFWIALRMKMKENWYVYWKNPGDSGMPPEIHWDSDGGLEIREKHHPYPQWIDVQGLTSYGFYGEILLMMEVSAPPDLQPGKDITLSGLSDWLVCEDICVPGEAYVTLTLPVKKETPVYSKWKNGFDAARKKWPAWDHGFEIRTWTEGSRFVIELDGPPTVANRFQEMKFFAFNEGVTENGGPQMLVKENGKIYLLVEKSIYATTEVSEVGGVLFSDEGFDKTGEMKAIAFSVSLSEPQQLFEQAGFGFLMALLFAFIGGLILNLMPCVFPVLSIKIMHFVHLGGGDQRVVRMHGYLFTAGVLISFLILAGALIGLRAVGEELGWGFQLQSPIFIAILAFLMFGLALNLLGVFEFGNFILNVAGNADTGEGYRSAFLTGVLATILATPCTAPFMGAALGYAITLPAAQALLIFGILGLGMATPYVILSVVPALLKALPKPGAWMETFKQAMAFPLLATVLWLAWVYGVQTGVNALFALLGGLLMASLGAWILNRWPAFQISSGKRIFTRLLSSTLLIGGLYISISTAANSNTEMTKAEGTDGYGITWLNYTPELIEQLRADGKHIFIDFTAAWCITCKANERVVFTSNEVRNRFNELDVAMVKADWTNRNPDITRALALFNRNGVPLYVIYPGDGSPPRLLPEILTPGIVLNALEELEKISLSTLYINPNQP